MRGFIQSSTYADPSHGRSFCHLSGAYTRSSGVWKDHSMHILPSFPKEHFTAFTLACSQHSTCPLQPSTPAVETRGLIPLFVSLKGPCRCHVFRFYLHGGGPSSPHHVPLLFDLSFNISGVCVHLVFYIAHNREVHNFDYLRVTLIVDLSLFRTKSLRVDCLRGHVR